MSEQREGEQRRQYQTSVFWLVIWVLCIHVLTEYNTEITCDNANTNAGKYLLTPKPLFVPKPRCGKESIGACAGRALRITARRTSSRRRSEACVLEWPSLELAGCRFHREPIWHGSSPRIEIPPDQEIGTGQSAFRSRRLNPDLSHYFFAGLGNAPTGVR